MERSVQIAVVKADMLIEQAGVAVKHILPWIAAIVIVGTAGWWLCGKRR